MTDALAPETELDPFGGEVDLGAALSERVLNQDEIDSLLGFDMGGGDDAAPSSTRPWSPMSACRCSRSSSTAWCG